MLIPLWLPWTVVAVLLVAALLQPPPVDDGERAREVRTVGLVRAWSVVAVVALVATVLTFDRLRVSEEELAEALDHAIDLSEASSGFPEGQVAVLAGDRLGHEVALDSQSQTDQQRADGVRLYEVQVSDGVSSSYDGPLACLEVTGDESWYADADEGSCEDQ